MKRILFFMMLISALIAVPVSGQVGKFLKNVKNAVVDDLTGKDGNASKPASEPSCACDPAELIFEGGKNKIDYSELNISVLDDGRVLFQDRLTGDYFISNAGKLEGPLKSNDPRIKQFEGVLSDSDSKVDFLVIYKDYITKQGDKFIIRFDGKTYGPYGMIQNFGLSAEKDKFAALVVENVVVTEKEGDAMDKAIANAKTEDGKIALAMKYSQQMQQKIISGGGANSMLPKLVSNMPVPESQDYTMSAYSFYTKMKYNEIVLTNQSGIKDLSGKQILNLQMGTYDPDKTFISSDNSKYATYSYGTLTFSDGKKLADLSNPHFVKKDGKINLAYMYYSPKRNAIMQCAIPF